MTDPKPPVTLVLADVECISRDCDNWPMYHFRTSRCPAPLSAPATPRPDPTHRCRVCGALWIENPPSDIQPGGSWSLWSRSCWKCCDNVKMGEQIERITGWRPLCDPGPWGEPVAPSPSPRAAPEDGTRRVYCRECTGVACSHLSERLAEVDRLRDVLSEVFDALVKADPSVDDIAMVDLAGAVTATGERLAAAESRASRAEAEAERHARDWNRMLLAVAEVVDTEGDPEALVADEFDPWEALRRVASERAARARAEAERDALRQAHWDGRAEWGFDNDGDPTPGAIVSDFAALIRDDWRTAKERVDESDAETEDAESARARAEEEAGRAREALAEVCRILRGAGNEEAKADAAYVFAQAALASPTTAPATTDTGGKS